MLWLLNWILYNTLTTKYHPMQVVVKNAWITMKNASPREKQNKKDGIFFLAWKALAKIKYLVRCSLDQMSWAFPEGALCQPLTHSDKHSQARPVHGINKKCQQMYKFMF